MLCPRWGIPINGNYGGITCNSCGYSQSGMRRIANVCPYLSKTGGMMRFGTPFWVDRQIIKG